MSHWRAEEIAYCANVHPGTTAAEIENHIGRITRVVRERSGLPSMYAGLWICQRALREYQSPAARRRLRRVLDGAGLQVVTFNGFPQGDFHQPVVKTKVYRPTWAQLSRLRYSVGLAELLAACLPSGTASGTISTLPLAYRSGWSRAAMEQACANLLAYARRARAIHHATGKQIRLCLEMEPGCVLQQSAQVIEFFQVTLKRFIVAQGLDQGLIDDYLGVCFDICHQAVMQENIAEAVREICRANIRIGKIQVSSALTVDFDAERSQRAELQRFIEPKYLHQVTAVGAAGGTLFADDLAAAMNDENFARSSRWWIHFHLPIQSAFVVRDEQPLPGLATTREAIAHMLDALDEIGEAPHLEIETYTWHVLPEFQRPADRDSLIAGLCQERAWLLEQMHARQLIKP